MKEDWALTVGGGRVRGTRSNCRGMRGEGLENKVEEPQEERNGRDSLLDTNDSSVGQQHRTTFCALKHALSSSNKPGIFFNSGFLVDACSGALNPFRTAVPFWGQTTQNQVVCPQNGTAVLNGLRRGVVVFWCTKWRDVGCCSSLHDRVTSVLICRRILPRICVGEFFTLC